MNRGAFFKTLAVSALSLPAIARAVAAPQPRMLEEWIRDVVEASTAGRISVYLSADAIEHARDYLHSTLPPFRANDFMTPPRVYFSVNYAPYRYDAQFKKIMRIDNACNRPLAEWHTAPYEMAYITEGTRFHFASYNRKTFRLTS